MGELTRLVWPVHVGHSEDVAAIRAALNAMGYDASDADIEQAYSDYSEECWAAGWAGIDDHDRAAEAVRDRLVEEGGD